MHDVTGMSIASLQEAMARGETSAEEIAAAFLARIREKDDAVGAYLTVTEEEALAQARAVDARRARGLNMKSQNSIEKGEKNGSFSPFFRL